MRRKKKKKFNRKASINKEMKNKVDVLEAGGSTCHKCISRDELENEKKEKNNVDENAELIMKTDIYNKEMKKEKLDLTKSSKQCESDLQNGH